jgi:UDP-N-acetylmuramate dehydrogenase
MQILLGQTMASHTTLGVGGHIAALIEAEPSQVDGAVSLARMLRMPLSILGSGSNILASDTGIDAAVVRLVMPPNESIWPDHDYFTPGGPMLVRAYGSCRWDSLVGFCVANRWQGLECLSGVPGTVGAAPVQNVGCYGQQVSDAIVSVMALDLREFCWRTFTNEQCGFGYRTSIFNRPENLDRYIITEVVFRLHPDGVPCREYDEVASATTIISTLEDVRRTVLRIRRRKGMLHDIVASAGSFFKNPVVDVSVADRVVGSLGGSGWFWPTPAGIKLSAARLIGEAGFTKGYTRGKAAISSFHTLALVNLGGATAENLCALAREIQEGVHAKFGVLLQPEVRLMGFRQYPLVR